MFPNTNNPSATTLEEHFFNFPWPFLDDMVHLLPINNSNAPASAGDGSITNAPATTTTNIISKEGVKRKHGTMKVPSKRRGKKDRHSKIRTAQGLRDRRMRLSLKVARKFFDLQDMLGFDKASKTIDWLLINSKDAIHQLNTDQAPAFNINRHIMISDQESQVDSEATEMEISPTGEESNNKPCREKRKRRKYSCNVAITSNPIARASRDKARARARERTKEKLMIRSNTHYSKLHLHEAAAGHEDSSQKITSSSPLGETQAVMNELLGITRSSSSSTFSPDFVNHNNDFPGLWSSMEEAIMEPAAGCYSTTISSNGVQWNPRSAFSTAPCTQDQQNHSPNSILVSSSLQDQILLTTPAVFTATNSNVCFQPIFPPNQCM